MWSPTWVDEDGVLSYRRHKTHEFAVVPLPEPLATLLRDIPLERDSLGSNQPFRSRDTMLASDKKMWTSRIERIFELAGITEVQTDLRVRKPHVQMFRDTAAVYALRHGAGIHSVSKMLGHANTQTTEKAYLPFVKELQDSTIADLRKALAGAKKVKGKVVTMKRG